VNDTAAMDVLVEAQGRGVAARLARDRAGRIAAVVVILYAIVALGAALGVWGSQWRATGAPQWAPSSLEHPFGTNRIGQDVFARALYSTKTAFTVGLAVALAATFLGALLGALAGHWRGSWLDELLLWLMGVLDAIPFYLFVVGMSFALEGAPYGMHVAMILSFWTTTARLVRAEVMKLDRMDFVAAARVLGAGEMRIVARHLLPNTSHLLLVQATITFVAAVKSEVVLSFLGVGVKEGVSWGSMIAESTGEVLGGHFGNFVAASLLMFGLVLAFNVLADALQDALDPRLAP
jgi:peptide/nickel transport system permease protein